ncbi:MAG: hypothetical protein EOO58_01665 [Hymenobacter sp.]|nr:MAG: hypothetical protein EOO58_01665 [Hymenobacter sp.]
MDTPKLPSDFEWLPEMYADDYFPTSEVDKVKAAIQKVDEMTLTINELQNDFAAHASEIETGARESIAETVERVLVYFEVAIDIEDALGERDW